MALGLNNSMIWADSRSHVDFMSPEEVETLALWYDFTDASTMYQEVDSFGTNVSSDGDLIGRVKNKSYINLATADSIGQFARSTTSSSRPTFKLGGSNGNSYALFDGKDLVTKNGTGFGEHSSHLLAQGLFSFVEQTVFVVLDPDDNDNDGTGEIYLNIQGGNFYTDKTIRTEFQREDDEDTIFKIRYINGDGTANAPVPQQVLSSANPARHVNPGEANVMNYKFVPRNNTEIDGISKLGKNGNYQPGMNGAGIFHTGTGGGGLGSAQDPRFSFNLSNSGTYSTNGGASGKIAGVYIGSLSNTTFAMNPIHIYQGKIYEILIYNSILPVGEVTGINNYLMNKYL